jgi:hypothetical protein
VKITGKLVFAQGIATADGEPCLRANGIFRRTPPTGMGFSLENLFGDPK